VDFKLVWTPLARDDLREMDSCCGIRASEKTRAERSCDNEEGLSRFGLKCFEDLPIDPG
jgi:hypothetical protein